MKQAKRLLEWIEAAKSGGFALTKLNIALSFGIPFNKPHGFKVKAIGEDFVQTYAPYKRRNFNHIKGIHACGIATISEFATGLLLMRKVDSARFRIIMSEMRMEYHYQAKKPLIAEAKISNEELQNEILKPLESEAKISKNIIAIVNDTDGNHVATAHITWQIKNWSSVKTKV